MSDARTILLTGGTGTIGSQLVRKLIEDGHTVVITTRSDITAEEFAQKIGLSLSDDRLHAVKVDFEDDAACGALVDALKELNVRPNTLINNARNPQYLKLDDSGRPGRANWMGEYLLDVVVAYELSMALADQDGSQLDSIVNVASMYGMVAPRPDLYEDFKRQSPVNYGVAKAALIHLTKEMAIRLADRDIRVNAISYGGVQGLANEAFQKRYEAMCPSGGMLEKDEVYGAVEFLVSDASRRMTGQNLVVDGGWTVW